MVDREHPKLPIVLQCALLEVARSSLYYRPREASGENLALMQAMDRQYLHTPFYGSRRMKVWLERRGKRVSRKRVQRLMRTTALRARRYDSTWYIPGTIHGSTITLWMAQTYHRSQRFIRPHGPLYLRCLQPGARSATSFRQCSWPAPRLSPKTRTA